MEQASTSTPVNKKRYLLAKASNRIFARLIDSFIVIVFCVGIGALIIATDKAGFKSANNLNEPWRYLLITIITAIAFFSYFILLPFLWKGKTLAMALLKLRIYNLIPTKNFLFNLIKREFFLWIVNIVANLILGVALASSSDTISIFDAFFKFTSSGQIIIVVVVQAFQMIGLIMIVFVIIHMCIFNRKRCFIDHVSDTCVIKYVDVNSKESNDALNAARRDRGPQRKYRLPGEVIVGGNDEIDSL